MNVEPLILHGIIRRGVVVLDGGVELPEGTAVRVLISPKDLPEPVRARLDEENGAREAAPPSINQWEREE